MSEPIRPAIYQAAHERAVVADRSGLGWLTFSGETRLDLIHRMSTNQVNGLQPGAGVATVLLTDIGRMIDRLVLFAGEDFVTCQTGEGNAEAIARYLMRFVFFNDDFHIEDVSATTAVWGVYGPSAGEVLVSAGFPDEALALHQWRQVELSSLTARLYRTDAINGDGYLVSCRLEDKAVWQQLLQESGLPLATADEFEFLRIEAGLPRFGHEISQEYIPLEANLWADVSFQKGCYIGQEVISRMESRGKLAKRLMSLTVVGPAAIGDVVQANGKKAGTLTSVATGLDKSVALGYIRTAVLDAGTDLSTELAAVSLGIQPKLEAT